MRQRHQTYPLTDFEHWLTAEGAKPATVSAYLSRLRGLLAGIGAPEQPSLPELCEALGRPTAGAHFDALSRSAKVITRSAWTALARFLRVHGLALLCPWDSRPAPASESLLPPAIAVVVWDIFRRAPAFSPALAVALTWTHVSWEEDGAHGLVRIADPTDASIVHLWPPPLDAWRALRAWATTEGPLIPKESGSAEPCPLSALYAIVAAGRAGNLPRFVPITTPPSPVAPPPAAGAGPLWGPPPPERETE